MDDDILMVSVEKACADCPPGYVRVVRMAHAGDASSRPPYHGPGWGNLPNPYNDRPSYRMSPHERCAATVHTFRIWWPAPQRVYDADYGEIVEVAYQDDFAVYVLEIPEEDVHQLKMQVIYNPQHARVVARFNPTHGGAL